MLSAECKYSAEFVLEKYIKYAIKLFQQRKIKKYGSDNTENLNQSKFKINLNVPYFMEFSPKIKKLKSIGSFNLTLVKYAFSFKACNQIWMY